MPFMLFKQTLDLMTQQFLQHQCLLLRQQLNQAAAVRIAPELICNPLSIQGMAAEFLYWDHATPARYILYLHGGGYAMGSIDTHRDLAAAIADAAEARVLLIDYRLAPEAPYPAALDDAEQAYDWLLAQGADASRITLAGDSAGGGLALALMQRLIARRMPLPACGVLLSPWLDLTCSAPSMESNALSDPLLNKQQMLQMAALYAPCTRHTHPEVSPLFGALQGLPPLLLQVSSSEVLRDDAVRLHQRAQQAGVDVRLEQWAHQPHGWHLMHRYATQGRKAIQAIGRFVREYTAELDRESVTA